MVPSVSVVPSVVEDGLIRGLTAQGGSMRGEGTAPPGVTEDFRRRFPGSGVRGEHEDEHCDHVAGAAAEGKGVADDLVIAHALPDVKH